MKKTMRGDSKVGCIFYLAIIAVIGYAAYMWGESKWNYETMKEKITEINKFWVGQKTKNLVQIKEAIIEKGDEIGLVIYEEDIEITVRKDSLTIDVYWDTPIKFPGYTYYIEHHVNSVRRRFY